MQPAEGATRVTGEPGFLVTGSGRSGTLYTAELLKACGLHVEHEGWWTLHRDREPIAGLDGDVSWLGCYDFGYQGTVYAQVRNPLHAIPSIHAREHLYPYYLIRRVTTVMTGDWAVDAARIWLDYTRTAHRRAVAWWRVDDIDAALLTEHFGVDPDTAAAALDQVPTGLNSAGRQLSYPWPDHPVIDAALTLGQQLGFEIHDKPQCVESRGNINDRNKIC